jgi:hypothetical protein
MSDDNSKMHYFQGYAQPNIFSPPDAMPGLSNVTFVTRSEFEELKNKIYQSLNTITCRLQRLEEHKTRQIDENRNSFNSLEELRVKLMLLERRQEVKHTEGRMTYLDAWKCMLAGDAITRLGWKNDELRLTISRGVMTFQDVDDDEDILCMDDLNANDWVTVR